MAVSAAANIGRAVAFQMTLLHEMIHQYVYEVLKGSKYTIFQHGLRFHLMRLYLNHKYKLKI